MTVVDSFILGPANTSAEFHVASGTPGNSYQLQFAVTGSTSGRTITAEIIVTLVVPQQS